MTYARSLSQWDSGARIVAQVWPWSPHSFDHAPYSQHRLKKPWESLVDSQVPFSWIHAQKCDFQLNQFRKLICEFLCIPRVLWRALETAFACSDISYYLSFPLILVACIIEESVLHIRVLDCEFTKATIALSTCPNSFFSLRGFNILCQNCIISFNFIIYWLIIWMYHAVEIGAFKFNPLWKWPLNCQ